MTAIFDHLTAIIVGGVLLLALLTLQQRSRTSAIETSVHHRAQTHATQMTSILERELENARNREQAEHTLGYYQFKIERSSAGANTGRLVFQTLTSPEEGEASPVQTVAYVLEPSSERVQIDGEDRRTFRLTRYTERSGSYEPTGSLSGVTGFEVKSGSGITSGSFGVLPEKIHFSVEVASAGTTHRSGDQRRVSSTNIVRHGASVTLLNHSIDEVELSGEAVPARPTPGLPELPDLSVPDPDPDSTAGQDPTPGDDDSDDGSSNPSTDPGSRGGGGGGGGDDTEGPGGDTPVDGGGDNETPGDEKPPTTTPGEDPSTNPGTSDPSPPSPGDDIPPEDELPNI